MAKVRGGRVWRAPRRPPTGSGDPASAPDAVAVGSLTNALSTVRRSIVAVLLFRNDRGLGAESEV
jgi:hypothetical protein